MGKNAKSTLFQPCGLNYHSVIVNGSSRTQRKVISKSEKWKRRASGLLPPFCFTAYVKSGRFVNRPYGICYLLTKGGTVKTVPYGICYLLTNGPSRTPVPTIKWRLYVLYLAPALRKPLPFHKRTVVDAEKRNK